MDSQHDAARDVHQTGNADRHQTLRAAVAWSYELLGVDERKLVDRLSVFTGGFTLAAAEAVCVDAELDTIAVDELVVALADKSMIVADTHGRYRLLETLRQFGEEQLQATSDPDRFRRSHLEYFTSFAVACHDGLQSPDHTAWLRRMHDDWPNLRAAFGWAKATADLSAAATMATNLIWAAWWHDVSEPQSWIRDVAAMPRAETHPSWHSILAGVAYTAWRSGRLDDGVELGIQAITAEPAGQANIDYCAEVAISSAAFFMPKPDLSKDYWIASSNGHTPTAGWYMKRSTPRYTPSSRQATNSTTRRFRWRPAPTTSPSVAATPTP